MVFATDSADLISQFGLLGKECPGRLVRSAFDREIYCLRRYLFTLASYNRLQFPISVEKSETPDFIINCALSDCFGLEHTEATNEPDQREMSVAARENVPMYLHGTYGGHGRGGFIGSEPERLWLRDVINGISKKSEIGFATKKTRLLLYSNSHGGSYFDAGVAAELLKDFRQQRDALCQTWHRFDEISIIKGDKLILDIVGDCELLPIVH